jgi:hypothetical protein
MWFELWIGKGPGQRYLQIENEEKLLPNPYVYHIFLHIDNEELLLPNPYDYPWFVHIDNEEWLRSNSYDIPDFWIWTMTNGCTQTHMINRMPEISVNHTDLGAAILHCPFLEISDIICVWAQPFFIVNTQKSGISYEFGRSHSSLSISRNQGYHMNLSINMCFFN